jgi:hypothetical protein
MLFSEGPNMSSNTEVEYIPDPNKQGYFNMKILSQQPR